MMQLRKTLKSCKLLNKPELFFFSKFGSLLIKIFILIGFTALSLTNFISHSELWSITSAKLLGSFEPEALIVYIRPLYYAFLKIPYYLPLSDVQHVVTARFQFGLLAFINFLLSYKLAKLLSTNRSSAVFYSFFLLTFHVYFYNTYRVRSDFLCELFTLIGLIKILTPEKKYIKVLNVDLTLPVVSLLASLSTPKSIYSILLLCFIFIVYNYQKKSLFNLIKECTLNFLAPAYLLLASSLFTTSPSTSFNDLFAVVMNYYLNSLKNSWAKDSFSALYRSLQINFLQYILIISGLVLYFKKPEQKSLKGNLISSIFFFNFFILIFHPERWDYFIASIVPYLAAPSIFVFAQIKRPHAKLLLAAVLLFTPLYMTHFRSWWHSNKRELENIATLSRVLKPYPNWQYFDATGSLPRHNVGLRFLGPNDPAGNSYTIDYVENERPEVIFKTPKLEHGGADLVIILYKNYTEVLPGLWVLTPLSSNIQQTLNETWTYPPMSIFVYDYPPCIRYFSNCKPQ